LTPTGIELANIREREAADVAAGFEWRVIVGDVPNYVGGPHAL
jgi:hypothetical protein